MKKNADKINIFLAKVDEALVLPLSDFHKLKIILRHTLKALNADRCWLLYPCDPTAESYLVPIEETTPDYPGANILKAYTPTNPICQHVSEDAKLAEAVVYNVKAASEPALQEGYEFFKIQSQMGCKIEPNDTKAWCIGVHHCAQATDYSGDDKALLVAVSKRIKTSLNHLLHIPSLINAAELSTEMFDNNSLAQAIYNNKLNIVYANRAYCELNGRDLRDIINHQGTEFLAKTDHTPYLQFFDSIDETGIGIMPKLMKETGSGKIFYTETHGHSISYNGEMHYLITSKDITQEMEAQLALSESLDVQHAVLEASDDGVLVEDINRHVIAINQNFYSTFDITPPKSDVINTLDLLKKGMPIVRNSGEISPLVQSLAANSAEKNTATIYLNNGTVLKMDSFPLVHKDNISGRVWYFKNITEEFNARSSLENSLDIQRAITEASDDGMLVEDTNRNIITVNQVFVDTFQITQSTNELKSISALEALSLGAPFISNIEEIGSLVNNISASSKETVNALLYLTDGSVLDMNSFPLIRGDDVHGRVWYFKDITEKHKLAHKLSFEATHDPLTKLMNRRGFDEILKNTIETVQQSNDTHALLYLDLDHFKIINDTSGHAAGDIALIEISKLIGSLLRKADLLARVGGDEFCILLNNCTLTGAKDIGEKIRQAVDEYIFTWGDKDYNLGVSIGIISLDVTVNSYEEALNFADTSCYLAKEEGRNRIHIHTTSDQAVMQRLQQGNIVSQIQDALRANRFCCYVQKICTTKTASLTTDCEPCNYEVLVRMLDEKGNIIAPYQFLPPAERYKLMHNIDHWVINNSIQEMATIQDYFGWLSINLSGQTIANEDTYQIIVDAIEASGMAANKLCFEITETAAISNPKVGIEFLEKLQALGCKIALDDFGTGLSSYEYLKKLPADILKIDGQFIKNMLDDELDLAMVKSINEIGHLMGKETVGEFVENADILNKLQELGIDYAQGYHLHVPCSMQSVLDEYLPNDIKANLNR